MREASMIADAIANTLENDCNWLGMYPAIDLQPGFPWVHFGEKYKGYFCWNWADAFYIATKSINAKCFAVQLQAGCDYVSARQHWFVQITTCFGSKVYVDDGFWNKRYCHDVPPCGGDYVYQGEQCLGEDQKSQWPCPYGPDMQRVQ